MVKINTVSNIKKVDIRYYHKLMLTFDGKVYGSGYNGVRNFFFTDFSIKYGQIGTGDTAQQTNPFLMFENATDIATGYLFSILLSHTGNVYHCGYNTVRILN